MEKPKEYRQVNQILGRNPQIGPFTISQALVFSLIILLAYILKQGLNLSWIQFLLFIGWGIGSYLMLFGERHWIYTNKFISRPYFIRGYVQYKSLQNNHYERKKRNKKDKRREK